MIVDDETDIYQKITNIFVEKGFEIEFFKSGQEAIQKAQKKQYNVVLLDINPPDIKGIDLLEDIKQTNPNIDLILVSHESNINSILSAFNKGVTACFLKPLNADNVIATINNSIQKQILIGEKRQTEQKLKESEEKYRLIIENSNDMISVLNDKFKYEYINENIHLKILGYSKKDLIGNINLPIIHLDDRKRTIIASSRILRKGKGSHQVRFKTKEGNYKWLEVTAKIFFDSKGNKKVLNISRDITERKLTEIKIKKLESKLRGRVKGLNCLYGISKINEKPEMSIDEIFQETLELIRSAMQYPTKTCVRIIYDGKEYKSLNFKKTKWELDSTARINNKHLEIQLFYFMNKMFLKEEKNLISEIRKRLKIIIEQRELGEKLKRSEEKYRLLFDNIPIGVGTATFDGTLIAMNKMMQKIIGYSFNELKSIGIPSLYVDSKERDIFMNILKKEGKAHDYELKLKRKDDSEFIALLNIDIVGIKSEKFLHTTIKDITEQRSLETKLKKSKDILLTILNVTTDAVLLLDQEGTILLSNEIAAKNVGISLDKFIGMNNYDFFPTDVAKSLKIRHDEVFRSGKSIRYEFNTFGIYFDVSIYPIFDDQGKVKKLAIFGHNITDRKRAEEELLKSEERYRRLVENLHDCIWSARGDGKSYYVSNAIESILGFTPEEFLSDPDSGWNLIHPDYSEKATKAYDDLFSKKKLFSIEYPIKRKDGKYIWVHDTAYKTYEKNGQLFVDGLLSDITRRKRLEVKLKESEEKFRILAEQSLFGIGILQDNIVKYVNHKMSDILGYSMQEMLHWNKEDLINTFHPEDKNLVMDQMRRKQSGSKDYLENYQHQSIKKNGEIIWLEVFSNIIDYNGKPANMIEVLDITERKILEEELIIKEKAIEASINGIVIAGLDGVLKYVNPQFLKMWGYSTKLKILGKHTKDFWKSEDDVIEVIKQLFNKGSWRGELIGKKKDGTLFSIQVFASLVLDKNENPLYMVGSLIDVSEQKKAEERMKLLSSGIEQSTEGIAFTDLKGNLLFTNNAFANMHGYNPNELIGKHLSIFHTPDQMPTMEATNQQILDQGVFAGEIWHTRRDGSAFPSLMHKSLFKDEMGNPIGIIGTLLDITKKKEVEQKLKESEEKFRNITEQSFMGISVIQDGLFKYFNERSAEINGYLADEIKNWKPNEFAKNIHPEDREFVMEQARKKQKGDPDVINQYPFRIIKKNGEIRWLEIFSKTINYEGSPADLVMNIDITEKIETEKKLKESEEKYKNLSKLLDRKVKERIKELEESEEKYRKLIKTSPTSIVLLDSKGNIIDCNKITTDFLSLDKDELIGKKFYNLEFLKDRSQWAYEIFTKILKGELEDPINFYLTNKDGKTYFLKCFFSLLKMGANNYIQVVSHDITSQKNVETLIKKEIEKLREIDQIKNDLIQRIAHELRTPLTSIYSGSEFLLNYCRDKMDDKTQKILNIINIGGYRLKELVDNLLLTFGIETDKLKLQLENSDIIPIIEESIKNVAQMASKRKILIHKNLHDNLRLTIDNSKIKKAILNLIFNAIQNTLKNGSVYISTKKDLNYIEIIIEDTGVGFTEREKQRIFKRFGKIERYGKGMDIHTEGLGLGLYIANKIIEMHGGRIWVESEGRNKGSTFIIRLPLKKKSILIAIALND